MAALSLMVAACVVSAQIKLTNALKRQIRKDNESAEEISRITSEAITQIRTIHSMNGQDFFYGLYCKSAEKLYNKAWKRAGIQGASYGLMGSYFSLNFCVAYSGALLLIRSGYSSPFSVFQAVESVNMGAYSVIMIAAFMTDYLRARVAANLIFKLLNAQPQIDSSSDRGLKPTINGKIELKNVAFAYPQNDNLVLKDLNFKVEAGQTVAVVGKSGGGKSTICQIIERFYNFISGSIEIDGIDIRQINIQHLRQHIGFVPQQPGLFNNLSIADNIAYGKPSASRAEIIEAATKAGANKFIQDLPNGYETILGKEGTLSGGQILRVSIARAFLLKTKILILDEINSSVDAENEKIIQEALENETRSRERSCIVISHRLNTVKNVDKIILVNEGQVLETGSHDELIQLGGLYAKMNSQVNE